MQKKTKIDQFRVILEQYFSLIPFDKHIVLVPSCFNMWYQMGSLCQHVMQMMVIMIGYSHTLNLNHHTHPCTVHSCKTLFSPM